jgi:hypothetical protein
MVMSAATQPVTARGQSGANSAGSGMQSEVQTGS